MIDQNSQFFAILTNVGAAKQANADALGIPWKLTQLGVGDANGTDPTPSATQTKLINERRRAQLNQLKVDPNNAAVIIAEQVIPESVGGWWIREIGLYDADNDLVAVANCAPSFKPILSQGSGRTQVVRLNLIVSSSANIELKIDPSVVLATRQYVDSSIINVLPATRRAGTFTKVKVNNRGIVEEGSNPTTLSGYGITDALARGDYGVGGATAPTAAIDTIGLAGGFYSFGGDNTSFIKYCGLINIPYSNVGFAAQIGFQQGTTEPAVHVRSVTNDGAWTPTRMIWHSGNLNPGNFAQKATTLAGYGITDAFTKNEVNSALSGKADKATTLSGYGIADGLARGDFGLGATAVKISAIDKIGLAGGFYSFGNDNTSFIKYCSLINIPYFNGAYSAQIGFQQGTTEPSVHVRSVTNDGAWTPTRKLWHSGDFIPSDFAKAGHVHDASQITSGILPIARGGTGANNAAGARGNIGAGVPATASLGANGWFKDNDTGLIYQWVHLAVGDHPGGELDKAVTFPMPFPNACLHVTPSVRELGRPAATASTVTLAEKDMSATGVTIVTSEYLNKNQNFGINVFAIGY